VFGHHEVRLGVGTAVTDRHGGVSRAPYADLNLAGHVGDDPHAVAANRVRLRDALGVSALVTMRQVHGSTVAVVDDVTADEPEADALVTAASDVALVVLVADCTPVLLWDRAASVVAAVHVGRRGLADGVLPATVEVMRRMRARPDRMHGLVGPGVCPQHYAVPAAMRDEVDAAAPGSAAITATGEAALDIRAGLLAQMHDAGMRQWIVLPHCTAETPDYYSYRRDAMTGRFAGLVWRQA
jgi:YfiH family protein